MTETNWKPVDSLAARPGTPVPPTDRKGEVMTDLPHGGAPIAEPGYNGWANYPTWNVALWLDNEEGSYNRVREMARGLSDCVHPRSYLADALKEMIRDGEIALPEIDGTMYADLLGYALDCVDWHEIAEHYLDEMDA